MARATAFRSTFPIRDGRVGDDRRPVPDTRDFAVGECDVTAIDVLPGLVTITLGTRQILVTAVGYAMADLAPEPPLQAPKVTTKQAKRF